MKCPIDQTTLVISERGGIEIDYCPDCRGVWLDRGELDKIIDRADPGSTPAAATPASSAPPQHAGSASGPGGRDQSDYEREHRAWMDAQQALVGDQRGYDQRGFDQRGYDQRSYDQRGYDQRGGYGQPRRKKKDNWLSDLFD